MRIIPLYAMALFALMTSSCSESGESENKLSAKTQEFIGVIKSVPEMIRETPGFLKAMYSALRELHAFVAENDYEKARATAATIDRIFESRTFSWYVQILAREEADGIPAAFSLIEELHKTEGISETEQEALKNFTTFLDKKGNLRSLDVLLLIGVAALESKCGKGTGAALLALQYPVRPDDFSSDALKAILEKELSPAPKPRIKAEAEPSAEERAAALLKEIVK